MKQLFRDVRGYYRKLAEVRIVITEDSSCV
jgi:hypothetical protein